MSINNRPLIKACLNGATTRHQHPAVPYSPQELALDAKACIAAGAQAVHVHARQADGTETLEPLYCDLTVQALRSSCPLVPIGMTTSLSAGPDPDKRLFDIGRWGQLPDFVSVNFSEPGLPALIRLLRERQIGIEAGIATLQDCRTFLEGDWRKHCFRVLVEVEEPEPDQALVLASSISALLRAEGVTLPQVHHGSGAATWTVIRQAIVQGEGIRIGLEDTTVSPDGALCGGNADLVKTALAMADMQLYP